MEAIAVEGLDGWRSRGAESAEGRLTSEESPRLPPGVAVLGLRFEKPRMRRLPLLAGVVVASALSESRGLAALSISLEPARRSSRLLDERARCGC